MNTVKLVYKDRSRDQNSLYRQVVFIDRSITLRIALLGPGKGGLYRQVVFRTGWTVLSKQDWSVLWFSFPLLVLYVSISDQNYRLVHYK